MTAFSMGNKLGEINIPVNDGTLVCDVIIDKEGLIRYKFKYKIASIFLKFDIKNIKKNKTKALFKSAEIRSTKKG